MPETLELKNNIDITVDDLLFSYQTKIENIDSLFETTHLILNEFQQPLLELKEQRQNLKTQLQDLLAKNEHLRRKDFDQMMRGILFAQVEKEKEIQDLLNSYLNEQRTNLNLLRENLARIKEALTNGQGPQINGSTAQSDKLTTLSGVEGLTINPEQSRRINESKETLSQILKHQDKRKEEVTSKLNEFQGEQKRLTQRFLELLTKGRELRIKDLRTMLQEFDTSRRERLVQHQERRLEVQKRKEEVRGMLVEFKKKRKEQVLSWRTNLPKANPPVNPEQSRRANEVNIDLLKPEARRGPSPREV